MAIALALPGATLAKNDRDGRLYGGQGESKAGKGWEGWDRGKDKSASGNGEQKASSQPPSAGAPAPGGQIDSGSPEEQQGGKPKVEGDGESGTGRKGKDGQVAAPAPSEPDQAQPGKPLEKRSQAPAQKVDGGTPAQPAPSGSKTAARAPVAQVAPAPVAVSLSTPQARTTSRGGGQAAPRPPRRSGRPAGSSGAAPLPASNPFAATDPLLSPAGDAPARDRPTKGVDLDEGTSAKVTRAVREIVEVVPRALWLGLAGLATLATLFAAGAAAATMRSRRLERQRAGLLEEVGLLQAALLPTVPPRLGPLEVSVAYRPAEDTAAGGDFYDAFELDDGRIAILIGDVSGHGREALTKTALIRYSLRAYLEAGLSPRLALQLAGRALASDLGDDFATVVTAVYCPGTAELTYASAGHPAPVIVVEGDPTGAADHLPAGGPASYPIGIGLLTGLRQTTVPLRPGMTACLYTDGLIEARRNGRFFGRRGIAVTVGGRSAARQTTGRVGAAEVIDTAFEWAGGLADDVAICLLRPLAGAGSGANGDRRVEEFEVGPEDVARGDVESFLVACEIPIEEIEEIAGQAAERAGRMVIRVEKRPGSHDVELVMPDVVNLHVEVADPGRAAGLLSRSA